MKKILIAIAALSLAVPAQAHTYTNGASSAVLKIGSLCYKIQTYRLVSVPCS